VVIGAAALFGACANEAPVAPASDAPVASIPDDSWLRGTLQEQTVMLAAQHAGFSAAMIEVGHRHAEMYWAGRDENWGYAAHQLNEMDEVIARGLERRPARAASAAFFMDGAIPDMQRAIEAEDAATYFQAFDAFTQACNSCHILEDVPFIEVHAPSSRYVNVRPRGYVPIPDTPTPDVLPPRQHIDDLSREPAHWVDDGEDL